jgi:hypothetical protein
MTASQIEQHQAALDSYRWLAIVGEFFRGGEKVASFSKQQSLTHRHEGVVLPKVNP